MGGRKGVTYQYFCPAKGCHFNPQSGRFFKVLDHLKTHYMKVHFEKKFKCSKCQQAFGLERDCLRHEKECGQTYTCIDCGKIYNKKTALSQHCLTKGHKVPPCLQKIPKTTTKCDTKSSKRKTPVKDKNRRDSGMVPILPKFSLSGNVSFLFPANRNDVTQTLCNTFATLGAVSCHVTGEKSGANVINQIDGLAVSPVPSQDVPSISNASSLHLFDNSYPSKSSCFQSTPTTNSMESLGRYISPQTAKASTSISDMEIRHDQQRGNNYTKDYKTPNKRQSQICYSSQNGAIVKLNNAHQQNEIFSVLQNSHPDTTNIFHLAGVDKDQDTVPTSSKSFVSQSEPVSKRLKAFAYNKKAQLPARTQCSKALFSSHSATSSLSGATPSNDHVSLNKNASPSFIANRSSLIKQAKQPPASTLISSLNFIDQSKVVQKNGGDQLKHLYTKSDSSQCSAPLTLKCISPSISQKQNPPHPFSTGDLVIDSETQTIESFVLDSLNSLLTDCETQTFNSSNPLQSLVNDCETQTSNSSAPFWGCVNDSETQTFENIESLNKIFEDCDTQTLGNTLPLDNIVNESGTQTRLTTTSDSLTQTLNTIMSDSTAQTSTDYLGFESDLYSSEIPPTLVLEDSACQVDSEEFFFKDSLVTYDMMTQTLDEFSTNVSSSSESLIKTVQTPSVKIIETMDVDMTSTPGTSTPDLMSKTPSLSNAGTQSQTFSCFDIMTQTNDLFNETRYLNSQTSQTDASGGPSNSTEGVQSGDKYVSGAQNFESFDAPSSIFDSFDSWTNSVDVLDSQGDFVKPDGSKNQSSAAPGIIDAVTQTLSRDGCTTPLLNVVDTITQTLGTSESMTQTYSFGPLIDSIDRNTQTSLQILNSLAQKETVDAIVQSFETLDSVVQTENGCDTLLHLVDSLAAANNCETKGQSTETCDIVTQTALKSDTMTQTANLFDTMTQTGSTFDTMTQTADNFYVMKETADNFNTMAQTADNFDTTIQMANNFDSMTQTADNFDMTQIAINFDTMTQTADNFDTMTQTANLFDSVTKTANNFDTLTQAANTFDTITEIADNFDTMTQTANYFDTMTQTANYFDTMTQTANFFDTMTQTTSIFDTMTQTTNNFDMTQTTNNFDTMTQTTNNFDTMTQTTNNFDTMTQTTNNFDTMTQTTSNFDTMTQTTNNFDTMTQTTNNFDAMIQTADNFDTMTHAVNSLDTMTQTANNVDMMTQTADNCDTLMQTDNNFDINSLETVGQTMVGFNMMTQTANSFDTTTQTVSGFDTTTQTADMFGSFDLGCDIHTQTLGNDIWEVTTQTDDVQGSDMMTQTIGNNLWEMMTQTDQDMVSDMMTQTGSNDMWELTPQTNFDLTSCDIFTQTREADLWEMTTQTDEILGSDRMTQTMDGNPWESAHHSEEDSMSDMMTQTADDSDLWDMTA